MLDNVRSTTQDAALKDKILVQKILVANILFDPYVKSPCILSHEAMMIILSIVFVLIENGMLRGNIKTFRVSVHC